MLDVLQCLARLARDPAGCELERSWLDADLAREVQRVADAHRLGEGQRRRRDLAGVEELDMRPVVGGRARRAGKRCQRGERETNGHLFAPPMKR